MSAPVSPPAVRRRVPSWLDVRFLLGIFLVVVSVVAIAKNGGLYKTLPFTANVKVGAAQTWANNSAGTFLVSGGQYRNEIEGQLPQELREERRARFMAVAEEVSAAKLQRRVGATMQILVDKAPMLGKKGGIGRSYADAPEIDGIVRLLPPEKLSKQLKVGEFTRARIVATEGHDLVALPI